MISGRQSPAPAPAAASRTLQLLFCKFLPSFFVFTFNNAPRLTHLFTKMTPPPITHHQCLLCGWPSPSPCGHCSNTCSCTEICRKNDGPRHEPACEPPPPPPTSTSSPLVPTPENVSHPDAAALTSSSIRNPEEPTQPDLPLAFRPPPVPQPEEPLYRCEDCFNLHFATKEEHDTYVENLSKACERSLGRGSKCNKWLQCGKRFKKKFACHQYKLGQPCSHVDHDLPGATHQVWTHTSFKCNAQDGHECNVTQWDYKDLPVKCYQLVEVFHARRTCKGTMVSNQCEHNNRCLGGHDHADARAAATHRG